MQTVSYNQATGYSQVNSLHKRMYCIPVNSNQPTFEAGAGHPEFTSLLD